MKNIKQRGFEVCSKYENDNIHIPFRHTETSAGYDFEASQDVLVKSLFNKYKDYLNLGDDVISSVLKLHRKNLSEDKSVLAPTFIPTGIKAYMQPNEYLSLNLRSSVPRKLMLILSNSTGIVDSDYYNNPTNEGEIAFSVWNLGPEDILIKKGQRIGQGVFLNYLLTDTDSDNESDRHMRQGGYGSTDNQE